MTPSTITELAPAKVNLTLRVGAARPDGYHPLDSLVVFADWGDMVEVRPGSGLLLTMSGEASRALPPDGNNLVLQAARALQVAAGIDDGAMIRLDKQIPVEAGLGGGSADAAATLRALNRLWGLDWTLDRLAEIGLTLGADVPACLYARPLRMRGIGEWIDILPAFDAFDAVILNPGVAVPTGPIFKAFDAADPAPLAEADPMGEDRLAWLRGERNDLEASAVARHPEIAGTLDWLRGQAGVALARMSGSGASCFALCADRASAERVADAYDGFARAVCLTGAVR
ncbi:4-(cytidine 5'-diphospho)-2-C-methyl-D-erythritol kinase [Maricaulis sp.]|uniref:4-(cytidine 5'-diphospho)-2-C-methyl-D-erythritol kinase n=1 Tax=Maricaulis sp. TaxID=1486257 RepID=UPI00260C4F50|nr:4-(cytidine 5'-diphospho)-2-C-methyl-D-erythritol kinase [Maricaulis sp.]MDF1768501.1 4-(cytidine 5'-diphospho)-2-C-methyl-D-erythritol kinase [Maricaulis sp.]